MAKPAFSGSGIRLSQGLRGTRQMCECLLYDCLGYLGGLPAAEMLVKWFKVGVYLCHHVFIMSVNSLCFD